jgi:hypothetical protein
VRVALAGLLALAACSERGALATLTQKHGPVERDLAARVEIWTNADVGASFALGDGVRTRSAAGALLRLDDASVLELGADTLVRFSATPPPPNVHAFDVQTGVATLSVADEPLELQTRVGLAKLERRSNVVLSPDGAELRFEVRVGRAVIGTSEPLVAGDRVNVDATGALSLATVDTSRDALARANLELADPSGAISAIVKGQGVTLRTPDGWSPLAEGAAELASGSEIETPPNTSVDIARDGQRATLGGNGSYRVATGSGALVRALRGSIEAGGTNAVRVEVPGGVILIEPEGHASLEVGEQETRVASSSRDAIIDSGGRQTTLAVGQTGTLARDGAVRLGDVAARPEPLPTPGEDRADAALEFADVELAIGTSVVIHDPAAPTAVRFTFGALCGGRGNVELSHAGKVLRKGSGQASVALWVPPGNHRYALRCGHERSVRQRGQVTVVADAATRSMAAKPPVSTLLADGRKYTVLYQNRLPAITLSWPRAPNDLALKLVHEFGGVRDERAVAEPRHGFASGELAEGRHTFRFESVSASSRQTSVDIVFDNAAPRASLDVPALLDAAPGQSVTIAGTALPGSDVWVEDQRVRLDARGRFSTPAVLPTERRALAIKVVQPGRGTHLYLRRGKAP